ncbi:amidohydrolase [Propionicimonas sp.]|uniref:amidohydrolase n=1 Tax=Propionicimonas sp. TaxID=1955623 RepID=UPI0039E6FCA5
MVATSELSGIAAAKAAAQAEVEENREALIGLSHAIHDDPELSWEEHRAAARVADLLGSAGFEVTTGAYDLPTAVEAVAGDGDLTVAICAEYDALPGIGHGCGHNVIAAAGVGAAMALAPLAASAGLRVKLLGTPAEEHGGGKVALLRAGAFEDVDYSMMVHGMTGEDSSATGFPGTAVDRFEVTFHGRAAHAAGMPWQAVNAGAAATLAMTAVAMLRQHIVKTANLNGFVSEGGQATNIIPDRAVIQMEVRALDIDEWRSLKRRALACFEGAAIATGCTWDWRPTEYPYAPVKPDPDLARCWDANLGARGRTLSANVLGGGSTDMGNVTQVLPGIHPLIAFLGETAAAHSEEFTAAAITPAADDAVLDGAIALAWTALDAALDPVLRDRLLTERARRPAGATRISLEA